ncbi:ExeA family protein [Kingella negevensis]|uniref:ExeA family protein n=1 Tax=Kingella negevensis TaxID=1522312 RepID=UPI00254B2019|nr:AAA family ATPase [Kingella negevensis]MDK4680425.1 AAA family ATPase [Kingella negevensis]MDK4681852.1 AAA family ATPase [Kingella negevensis]MDK4690049.1 AAA family ATPase [Kingella negevensis]MDK4692605.1 AAA family ATPase [Kingella negevensis]MDK4698904.1 AAA family ATPase [Kingella negevensis]
MKTLFQQLGKPTRQVAKEIGCSKTTLLGVINHGVYPKRNGTALRAQIQDYFKQHGIDVSGILSRDTLLYPNQRFGQKGSLKPTPKPEKDTEMLLRKSALSQATRQHFGVVRDPFNDEIQSAQDIYLTPDVRYVREAMFQTATQGGFMAVVGESGAGKSTLREDLQDRINREGRQVVMIEPYVLAMEDNDQKGKTLKAVHIAEAILEAVSPNTSPKRSPEARFRQIHKALADSAKAGNKHVLMIEEAHCLPVPTLKHLKRFFELKNGFERLIGIVLIGQTELGQKLSENNPNVREVVQRCEVVTLLPLTDGKLQGYLKHKFERVGVKIEDVLTDTAIDAIAARLTVTSRSKNQSQQQSLLYPLAVNNLVSAAMNQAAELGFERVDADIVQGV